MWRTLQAFLIAAVVGVPLGVLLGSNEKAYRSVEFLIDFFRSTPSSALIPLFLHDLRRVGRQQGRDRGLRRAADRGVQQRLRRDQRAQAARDGGQGDGRLALADLQDVLVWESLQPTFVGLRSAVSMALVIVIVAEMFIGSDSGLGHRIINAQQVMNVKDMYASILAAGALGYALNILFLLAERRIVHWSGR